MNDSEIASLLSNFKEANKTLRSRAITIGVLFLIIIGLRYSESERLTSVLGLSGYQYQLEKIMELKDTAFKRVIDGDKEQYFPITKSCYSYEYQNVFKKIQYNNYDKKILLDYIVSIDAQMDKLNENKSVNILGFSIALTPLCYVFFFLMLIIFHDFTQTILYRKKTYHQLKKLNTQDWKFGNELFGFFEESDKPSLRFVRFISSFITSCFIVIPFINSMLLLNYNAIGSSDFAELLIPLNIVCIIIISLNTLIIFYSENILNIKYLAKIILGNYASLAKNQRLIWIMTLAFPAVIFFEDAINYYMATVSLKIGMLIIHFFSLVTLYFILIKCKSSPTKFYRGVRAFLLIFNFIWLYFVMFQSSPNYYIKTVRDLSYIDSIFYMWLFFAFIAFVISVIYTRFYMPNNLRKALR